MSFRFGSRVINRIGIVGSGQIGPDIALHLAKALYREKVPVTVVDFLPGPPSPARGTRNASRKGRRRGRPGPFGGRGCPPAPPLHNNDELREADLVIEAATENLQVKRRIFEQLETLCAPRAILASNSSHIEPALIFENLKHPERALVIHYFFPAERNQLVEIVPGPTTDAELVQGAMTFYEEIGKVPIRVGSRYGYAVNPVFEGLFLAAALAVEEGLGSAKEVDAAARRALGLGVGPFTAMNLTGGNPITHHALDEMTSRIGPWFRSPRLMHDAIASGAPWDVPKRDEQVVLPPQREQRIADAMLGAYFGICGEIADSGIVSLSDLELAVEVGLAMRAPFTFMNELGVGRALELVEAYAAVHAGFPYTTMNVPPSESEKIAWPIAATITVAFRSDHRTLRMYHSTPAMALEESGTVSSRTTIMTMEGRHDDLARPSRSPTLVLCAPRSAHDRINVPVHTSCSRNDFSTKPGVSGGRIAAASKPGRTTSTSLSEVRSTAPSRSPPCSTRWPR